MYSDISHYKGMVQICLRHNITTSKKFHKIDIIFCLDKISPSSFGSLL